MAFKLNSFVEDQVATAKNVLSLDNVVDRVTPIQVKQILNAKSKNAINDTLGDLSGIKNGQFFSDVGAQLTSKVNNFIQQSKSQIEAQVFGCLNSAIRDILDKNPSIEKILLFDQFINRELSKIKNKLESKIDFELRKIAYKKIKVHQVAIFKQKIRKAIKNICPDATPASPSQIRQYKDLLGRLKSNVVNEGVVIEAEKGENIAKDTINKTVESFENIQEKFKPTDISNTVKKQLKEDVVKLEEYKNKYVEDVVSTIKDQANKQVLPSNFINWDELYG
jgi:hypothetical protein